MPLFGDGGLLQELLKNFVAMVATLTDLLSPKVRFFVWSPGCDRAFDCVKTLLTNATVLARLQGLIDPLTFQWMPVMREQVLSSFRGGMVGWSILSHTSP